MPITKSVSSRSNLKQPTAADLPNNPANLVSAKYGPIASTAGQTVINLTFAVDQSNKTNFILSINGELLSETLDFTFTSVQANNTSSQITVNTPLIVGLPIQAWYLGVVQSSAAASSLLTLQAQANTSTAADLALARNYLLNGGFDFFQRATATTNMNSSLTYQTADRFAIRFAGTFSGTPTSQSNTSVPTNGLSQNCILFQGNSTNSTAEFTIEQRIESTLASELAGQQVSFSMQALMTMQSATIELYTPSAADNYTSLTLQATATVTGLNLGSAYGLVTFNNLAVPTTANLGLAVRIRIFNNSIIGSASNHRLTQFMLNVGPAVSGFKRVTSNVQAELNACQRYCELFISDAGNTGLGIPIAGNGTTSASGTLRWDVTKRAVPVSIAAPAQVLLLIGGGTTINTTAASVGVLGVKTARVTLTTAGSVVANQIYFLSQVSSTLNFLIDAEI